MTAVPTATNRSPLLRRLGWLALFWVAGVLTLGLVGLAIDLVLR